jgi:hypothetical protein
MIANSTAQSKESINIEIDSTKHKEAFAFTVGSTVLNKSMWQIPYRYKFKGLNTVSVKITIKRISTEKEELDFNLFTLLDETKKLRIRPTGVYYPKKDKRKYLKSKPINENYDDFKDTVIEGYENFQIETYKINFLGIKKKNTVPTVKSLKKLYLKARTSVYYLDFPVRIGYTYGKIYYKGKPVGFAVVKN